jgi:sigma-B regulation protein RsbU (phosphoserine phosphatase)
MGFERAVPRASDRTVTDLREGDGEAVADRGWDAATVDLLGRMHRAQPDELVPETNSAIARLGLRFVLYLIDHEQERLWALPDAGKDASPPILVDGTVAGRAFTAVRTQAGSRDGERPYRLWVPMVDGSERLGVVEVVTDRPPADPAAFRLRCETLVGLLGHLVTVKMPYGDGLRIARRTRPMSPAGELILEMLPPLTYSCHRLAISAVLEPCYDVGGDAYDYAVDGPMARVSVLDAMGRGLAAGLTSAAALAAMRAARRDLQGLDAMARAADAALIEQFPDLRFVTAVLAELDMETGLLRYINAGHPAPMLIRRGRVVKTLDGGRRMPLGLDDSAIDVGQEVLEPGDRLLIHTDGVTEAHNRDGERFGVRRLADLTERCMADRLPAPETLRRLAHTVLAHQGGRPSDDATLLLLEWSPEAAERTRP